MTTDLISIETLNPVEVFKDGGIDPIIAQVEAQVRAFQPDMTTDAGRKEIASIAYKVARSKTALDDMGKEFVATLKKQAAGIDEKRRILRERLDELKDEVRAPLTAWENKEKDRVDGHQTALKSLSDYLLINPNADTNEIKANIKAVEDLAAREWEEFAQKAEAEKARVLDVLNQRLASREKYEAEQAELARLRAAEAERLEKERLERIEREAGEKAKREADAALERERREKEEAQARADKAERDAKEAVQRERDRIAMEEAQKSEDARKREADQAHRAKVNNEALDALIALAVPAALGKEIITAIAKGQIPNVKIFY